MLKYIRKDDQSIVKDIRMEKKEDIVAEVESKMAPEVVIEQSIEPIVVKPKNKISEAKDLIISSQELVKDVDRDIEECQTGVSKAASDFDGKKRFFINERFKNSEELLRKVGVEYGEESQDLDSFELAVDATVGDKLSIRDISSGRFTGIILSLLGALATFATWLFFATKNLNIPLDIKSLNLEFIETHRDTVLSWIGGGMTGGTGNPMTGMVILLFTTIVAGWAIYALRLYFKTEKNLKVAKKAYIESQEYSYIKDESKREMLKIDGHLRDVIMTIDDFSVALNEQNAILKRIIHVEGVVDEDRAYHPNSKRVMVDTQRVMSAIEKLLNTSITIEGKVNPQSVQLLAVARGVYSEFIAKIYN